MKHTAMIATAAAFAWLALQGPAAPADSKQVGLTDTAPPETVVVTGRRLDQKNANQIIHNFITAHGALSPKIHQFTCWRTPFCSVVRGLPLGFAAFINGRIKAIAESVGAPTKDHCGLSDLNVEIIFSPDPQKTLDDIAKFDRSALGYEFADNTRVPALTSLIQAWYVTATGSPTGSVVDEPNPAYIPSNINMLPAPAVIGVPGGSRIWSPVYSEFVYVLILADAKKVSGYPIGPIADYIAMLALAKAKAPDDCSQLASILDYLTPDCTEKPESLTYADKAYLEGLYSMDQQEMGSFQTGDIAGHMAKSLEGK